jgi:hypothetical protein
MLDTVEPKQLELKNKAMKKTMRFLYMTALAMVGAVMTGCSSDDDEVVDNNKVRVLTTTIGFEDSPALTRALTANGEKTFGETDRIAVIYENTSGITVKTVNESNPEISNGGRFAKFTITALNPDASKRMHYIYPASMANEDGTVNTAKLASQDGTLETLAAELDCCVARDLQWDGSDKLPGATLQNLFAILAITLKEGAANITNSITSLTINDGRYIYSVSRSAVEGDPTPIYVAIQPTTSAKITVNASAGSTTYDTKELSGKTYSAGTGHNVTWTMTKEN